MCKYIILWLLMQFSRSLPSNKIICRKNFFKDAGEVVDVRLATNEEGMFKGFGHVDFATAEAVNKVSTSLTISF